MANSALKTFTSAGITTHSRDGVTVTKVRYGNDHVRLLKMLSSNKKIGVSYHFGGRDDGFLDSKRVDIVELPNAMVKADVLKFLAAHADFQSPEDQALIADEQGKREPKAKREPKVKKEKTVRASKKTAPSLDSIKSRAKKAAKVEDILAAVAE